MKKTWCCAIALAFLMIAAPAAGQNCKPLQLNFTVPSTDIFPGDDLYDEYVPMIEARFGIEPGAFGWCWTQRVIGTIPGTWVACGMEDLAIYDPFGFGILTGMWGNPGILVTARGHLFTMSYGLSQFSGGGDWVAFGGVTYYEGAAGKWQGAIGWGTDSPQHYPPSYWIRADGLLCRPSAAVLPDDVIAVPK